MNLCVGLRFWERIYGSRRYEWRREDRVMAVAVVRELNEVRLLALQVSPKRRIAVLCEICH